MPSFDRLSAVDASFLEIEDQGVSMHVAVVMIVDAAPLQRADDTLDIESIERFIEVGLHDMPRYRQKLDWTPVERHPVWIDDGSFNLRYHVRHTSLPRPGSERLLKRLAGRIVSQRLDRDKPLWEIWVVEGLEGGRIALIAKAHHCMVDGVAGMDVLAMLLRPTPDAIIEERPPWRPRPAPSQAQIMAGEIARRTSSSFSALRDARRRMRDPRRTIETVREGAAAVGETLRAGFKPASPTPLNPEQIGPYRRFDWVRFDLEAVKQIKNRLGGTVNDVVLATVAGACGEFLQRRGLSLEGLDFRALVPVSIRRDDEHEQLGNRVAQMIAPLPVAEFDPRRRLRRVIETTQKLKESRQTRGGEILGQVADWGMAPLLTGLLRLAARAAPYNTVVTNIPGPQTPLYLLGAKVLETYPMVPIGMNQALGIALFSYDGGLFYGLNADWDRVPDLHDLALALEGSFEELAKAADVQLAV